MRDLLLIFPEIYNSKEELRYPPFGLVSMASYVEKYGYKVDIFDRNLQGNTLTQLIDLLSKIQYRYVGISSMFIQKNDALEIINVIKQLHKGKIVVGGDYFVCYQKKFQDVVDYISDGDGEIFLKQLLECAKPKGIYKTEKLQNIDEIPIPSRRILNSVAWNKKIFAIKTSRGCPFGCIYCSATNNLCSRIRFHSAEYVVAYIEFIKNTYGITKFCFMDDVFTLNRKRVLDICKLLKEKELNIEIEECFSHVSVKDREMFETMKRVGFKTIQIGIESGNNNILKLIGKGITTDEICQTVNLIHECGINVEGLFMIGNIGETKETVLQTIDLMKKLPTHKDWFSFACPLPNSKFFEVASDYGTIITYDYNRYTNAEVVFVPNMMTKEEMEDLMKLAHIEMRKKIKLNVKKAFGR